MSYQTVLRQQSYLQSVYLCSALSFPLVKVKSLAYCCQSTLMITSVVWEWGCSKIFFLWTFELWYGHDRLSQNLGKLNQTNSLPLHLSKAHFVRERLIANTGLREYKANHCWYLLYWFCNLVQCKAINKLPGVCHMYHSIEFIRYLVLRHLGLFLWNCYLSLGLIPVLHTHTFLDTGESRDILKAFLVCLKLKTIWLILANHSTSLHTVWVYFYF